MRNRRGTFSSRFGFYMAAIGSAIGLGTLWRFPYVTGMNGGGAFVILYFGFVAAIGLPALICELMLGKLTRFNLVGALSYKSWVGSNTRWTWFGLLGVAASFIVLGYYTVVSGWVIHFIVQGVIGRFTEPLSRPDMIIDNLMSHGYLQVLLASVHLIITVSIVGRGVQDGIEKSSRIFMPILFLIMGLLVIHSMFLPGTPEALRFLFYPDFSKLSGTAVIEALGHALFTLSLGFGAMIAYGSYLRPEVHLPSESFIVAVFDTILSLCAGLIIFPIVFTAHVDAGTGPALLFKTMPVIFRQLTFGYWVALAFFVCLYFAALSSSIALFEGLVAYLMDQKKYSRPQAAFVVVATTFILALISSLSESSFKNIRVGERGLLEIIDQVIINWMLPVVTLGVILFTAFKVPLDAKKKEFIDSKSFVTVRLFSTWQKTITIVVPILIFALMAFQVISFFKN